LRLWLKRVPFVAKPDAPAAFITHGLTRRSTR
jgi:hypothetical protein